MAYMTMFLFVSISFYVSVHTGEMLHVGWQIRTVEHHTKASGQQSMYPLFWFNILVGNLKWSLVVFVIHLSFSV